ncbi:MAG: flagellar biosynthesis protein FlgN [Micrococcales bacterium]|nr:MAG: flagellar biosynthesis protein FlgN [Micrococcales bacterium]PIE26574.1 MAG: flagellar biosynthesis protein FlgN [Micrococcales bacterium]
MGLTEVSTVLWRERELLELLAYKLHVEQLVLGGGSRFLVQATREVEAVITEIRDTELARAVEVEAVGAELGLGSQPSLSQLAAAAPPPWDELFGEHRAAFLALTQEISELAAANREALLIGQRATRETLLGVTEAGSASTTTYDNTGRTGAAEESRRLVDRAL